MIPSHIDHIHLFDLDVPVLHGFGQLFITEEVTESELPVSGEISIIHITLVIDSLFEIGQVLMYMKCFGDSADVRRNYRSCGVQDAKKNRNASTLAIRLLYLRAHEMFILIFGVIIASR